MRTSLRLVGFFAPSVAALHATEETIVKLQHVQDTREFFIEVARQAQEQFSGAQRAKDSRAFDDKLRSWSTCQVAPCTSIWKRRQGGVRCCRSPSGFLCS